MKKADTTRHISGVRHYNDQNPNRNPGRERARAPQMVREDPFHSELRTILIAPARNAQVQAAGRTVNGAPLPVAQSVGRKKYG